MGNNKLIADFMGYKISDSGEYLLSDSLSQFQGSDHREWCSNRVENDNLIWEINKDCLEYHSSWDWLMPVVDKIERQHKANFETKCLWNEFIECSIYQVIVSIEQGEMSKDRACIYDSKKIYQYIGDAVKCKREATYKAVVEFIKEYIK